MKECYVGFLTEYQTRDYGNTIYEKGKEKVRVCKDVLGEENRMKK